MSHPESDKVSSVLEPVEVVATLEIGDYDNDESIYARLTPGIALTIDRVCECDQLMTVDQHERIMANLRLAILDVTLPSQAEPEGTTSDKYRAELYDEVWEKARSMGYGNVTNALIELERMKAEPAPAQDEQQSVAFDLFSDQLKALAERIKQYREAHEDDVCSPQEVLRQCKAWAGSGQYHGTGTGDSFQRAADLIEALLAARPTQTEQQPAYGRYETRPAEAVAGIAKRQLGDERRWVEIRDLNAHAFPDMGPHDYYPVGTVLTMPARPAQTEQKPVTIPEAVRAWMMDVPLPDNEYGYRLTNRRDELLAAPIAPQYPIRVAPHIDQFAEGVFVWYDEAALPGGTELNLEAAKQALGRYGEWLNGQGDDNLILTPRERQIYKLKSEGFTHSQIAKQLGLSVLTVKGHVRNGRLRSRRLSHD